MRPTKDVCGALIEKDGKFLVAKRKPLDSFGGLWEFPGGVIEAKETKEGALKREIKEELGIEVKVRRLVYNFEDKIPDLKINIYLFECEIEKGTPRPIDCDAVKWASLDELKMTELAPADKKVLKWIEARH